ncbi:hypothetical protein AB0H34_38410 [Saccharopolyspora shandongensis]
MAATLLAVVASQMPTVDDLRAISQLTEQLGISQSTCSRRCEHPGRAWR